MKTASNIVKSKQPLGATAYEEIYKKIVTLAYEPGRRLEEVHLVKDLGIGRTPVREALFKLAGDLMVESQPKKGYVVRPITLQNTKAAFEALKILELGVADLAVRCDISPFLPLMKKANQKVASATKKNDVLQLVEANSAFHVHYARCSGNVYLIEGLHKIRCETNRLAYLSYGNEIDPERSLPEHYESVVQQHNDIITHIEQRDETRLKETVCEHIDIFKNRIVQYLAS